MFNSELAFEEAQEKEYRRKVIELQQYKHGVRYTKDGDWTRQDLQEDIVGELELERAE